jgi:hypothetical protein
MGVHELTHLATSRKGQVYYDGELAQASHDVAFEQGYNFRGKTGLPNPTDYSDYPNGPKWVRANSDYYTGRLFDACSK